MMQKLWIALQFLKNRNLSVLLFAEKGIFMLEYFQNDLGRI